MPRRIDHLVICVHDLERAQQSFCALGFNLTPVGEHPFGTCNRLALLANNFLELLAVADPAAVPAAAPGRFSFGAHNQAFLANAEGMSMLALHSVHAYADAAHFVADGLGAYSPLDFGREARLPDGGTARLAFSLAFAISPAMPGLAFFTCQQHHAPELFWKADYQRHPNGALRIIEVVLSAQEPAAHRGFLERVMESPAEVAPGRLTVGTTGDLITVLSPSELARRLPGFAVDDPPRFRAARLAVADLDATERRLRSNGIACQVVGPVVVVPPAATHGLALEFVAEGAE
jgi:Glyoxalase-like domain